MRRFTSLAGVSLIAGGMTALLFFASSARGAPELPLVPPASGPVVQANGSGSGEETTTTTIGGNGSGATTTTTAAGATTTSTAAGGGTTTSTQTPVTATPLIPASGCTTPPTLSVTLQSVRPGGATGVGGACFPRNTSIALTLFSDPIALGTVVSDANGNFTATVTIPSNVVPGTHTLTASGGGQSASINLVVSDAVPLSRTGVSWHLGVLGLALIAAGIIVMAGDRIGRQELITFE